MYWNGFLIKLKNLKGNNCDKMHWVTGELIIALALGFIAFYTIVKVLSAKLNYFNKEKS